MRKTLCVVIAGVALAACSSDDDPSGDTGPAGTASDGTAAAELGTASAGTAAELVPAGEASGANAQPLGTTQVIDGMNVTVSSAEAVTEEDGVYVKVMVRVENPTSEVHPVPQFNVVCAASTEEGGSLATNLIPALQDMNSDLPAGSFTEGYVALLLPGDDRIGEPVPVCDTPAYVHGYSYTQPDPVDKPQWALPPEAIPEPLTS